MQFTFWAVMADGRHSPLDTNNIFEAGRRARALSAISCYCKNPGSGKAAPINM